MPQPPTLCEHLQPLLDQLVAAGAKIVFAGQAWSSNCRLWVYLDRPLDIATLRRTYPFAPVVTLHTHRGTHDGSETGFVCNEHRDAIMGTYVEGFTNGPATAR